MPIRLEETSDGFVLTQNDGSSLQLTNDDLHSLAGSVERIQTLLLAKHTPTTEGHGFAVAAIPIVSGQISYDPMSGEVLLTLQDTDGRDRTLVLSIDLAKGLHRELPKCIEEAEKASKKSTPN